eukprot:s1407_g2.t3
MRSKHVEHSLGTPGKSWLKATPWVRCVASLTTVLTVATLCYWAPDRLQGIRRLQTTVDDKSERCKPPRKPPNFGTIFSLDPPPCELVMRARELWMQGHLCDVTLKSCDGQTHRGHRIILSAASNALKALLGENFSEGQQIQQGQPIEIAASGDVLRALLDHIYGGEPEISSADATELLRLAGAYELPKLAAAIEEESRFIYHLFCHVESESMFCFGRHLYKVLQSL